MDWYTTIFLLIGITILLLHFWTEHRIGHNRASPFEVIVGIVQDWNKQPLERWGGKFKERMKGLSAAGFARFKMRGVNPVRRTGQIASRGYGKLADILRRTGLTPGGTVLSLCCGRGGWEQLIAPFPTVKNIKSYTLGPGPGHMGHEKFTEKPFDGMHKVKLTYMNVCNLPFEPADWVLFDGGESKGDANEEARKFNMLLSQGVMRHIHEGLKGFIIKILTPWHPETVKLCREIQEITGRGAFCRSSHSRNSTMELYLVSLPRRAIERDCSTLLMQKMEMARDHSDPAKTIAYDTGYEFFREEVEEFKEMLKPLDLTESINELGPVVQEVRGQFVHWESLGVFPWGNPGSKSSRYNPIAWDILRYVSSALVGFSSWRITDTTPEGFLEVFKRKVDTAPKENHEYRKKFKDAYKGMAKYFLRAGFNYSELTWEEVFLEANKQGAPGRTDIGVDNIGDYISDPKWINEVEEYRRALDSGKPKGGVFNTMGKREKKEVIGAAGSRMIAYLCIPMRLLELKIFGKLLLLTKRRINRFGVGGMGLHDLGMRLSEVWKGFGVSSDIAGFDTRISLFLMSMEAMFVKMLGAGKTAQNLYRLYAYPHILIPKKHEFNRSELLRGRGQRMSGTNVTYSMNTITRIVIMILEYGEAMGIADYEKFVIDVMEGKIDIGGCVSGDDAVFTANEENCEKYAQSGKFLSDIGMPRKNIPENIPSPISRKVEDVDFCSHHYERITYMDAITSQVAVRWMPTRSIGEIAAKASMRVGGSSALPDEQAWLSAQGNNLLVNYHHLPTARLLGAAFKAVVNPYLILTDTGGVLRPTPWMREGEVLDVINCVLFGESTEYPVPGFRVWSYAQLGYLKRERVKAYDPNFDCRRMIQWRKNMVDICSTIIQKLGTNGNIMSLTMWRSVDKLFIL